MKSKNKNIRPIELGYIEKGSGKHQSNTVYSGGGQRQQSAQCSGNSPSRLSSESEVKAIILMDLGVGGERGLVYDINGLCCCQSATQYKDANKVLVKKEYGDKKAR